MTGFLTSVVAWGAMADESASKKIVVGSWGGTYQEFQRTALFKPFSEANPGVTILDKEYPAKLSTLRRAARRTGEFWDIVQVEPNELLIGTNEGLFHPIDWKRIGQQDLTPDAVTKCGVGAIHWSMVLVYDPRQMPANQAPASWADFWDVKKFPGKRGFRNKAKFALEIALLADGVSRDQVYNTLKTPEGVERAFRKLEALKPHIEWWDSGDQPIQWLVTKNVVMTAAYNGRVKDSNDKGFGFKTVWKDNVASTDYWAVLKNPSNLDEIYKFLDYVSEPGPQIKLSTMIPYGPTNREAIAKLDADAKDVNLPTAKVNREQSLAFDAFFWAGFGKSLVDRFKQFVKKA